MLLRSLTAAASLLCTTLLPSAVTLASPPNSESLSARSIAQDLAFHYPVRPAQIALFGALVAPSSARTRTRACLAKGEWAMFWVPALSHLQIAAEHQRSRQALKVLKLSGPAKLQGILAFLEHPTTELQAGLHGVFNSDSTKRAFLVSSPTPLCIRIQKQGRQTPDQAWSRAWRSYWNHENPLWVPPPSWFDQEPGHPMRTELLSQSQALQELTQRFPESLPFARWLASLNRIQLASRTRPAKHAQFGQEKLLAKPKIRELEAPDFSDAAQDFAVATSQSPVELTVQGPANFELRARVFRPTESQPKGEAPSLRVATQTHRLAELALLHPRPDLFNPSLGPVSRHRFWLPKGTHRLSMRASDAAIRLSLRKAQAPPRLAAYLAHATPGRAARKAKRALKNIEKTRPKLAESLEHLLIPWQSAPSEANKALRGHDQLCQPGQAWLCAYSAMKLTMNAGIPAPELIPRLSGACTGINNIKHNTLLRAAAQQKIAQLAQALHTLDAPDNARVCLAKQESVAQSNYLKVSLEQRAPDLAQRSDPWLVSGLRWFQQRASSLALKSAYLRRRRKYSRQASIKATGQRPEDALRWLVPLAPDSNTPPSKHNWTQVEPEQQYTLTPSTNKASLGQVMRLLVSPTPSRSGQADSVILSLGGRDHQLDLGSKKQIFHWIISPNEHAMKVTAPPGTQVFCDQPLRSKDTSPPLRFGQRIYWPAHAEGPPLRFDTGNDPAPISLKLRVQVSNRPDHRQTLPLSLRKSNGAPVGLWLHYDPTTIDPSVQLEDFSRSSFPVSVQLGLLAADTQVWVRPRKHAPKLAVAMQRSELRALAPVLPQRVPELRANPKPYVAQGPATLKERIRRAHQLLEEGQRGALGDELEWIAKSSDAQLRVERKELLLLLHDLAVHKRRSYFAFSTPAQGDKDPAPLGELTLRAQFLDKQSSQHQPSKAQLERAVQSAAQALEPAGDPSISAALVTIANYLSSTYTEQQSGPSDALVFGMLGKITQRISGSVLSAWKGMVARRTRWKNVDYASQSAGHEWLQIRNPGQARDLPNTPWQDPLHTLLLSEGQQKLLDLDRNHKSELKVQGYCQPTRPFRQLGPTRLIIKINRGQYRELALPSNEAAHTLLELASGKNKLAFSIQHQQDRKCALRIQEKAPEASLWQPIELDHHQRWFVADKGEPVTIHARGPGTLQFQIRSLGVTTPNQALIIRARGPKRSQSTTRHLTSQKLDPNATLRRSETLKSSEPSEVSMLMSQPGVYRYELQSQGPQYLIRARTRVDAKARPSKFRFGNTISSLKLRLAKQQAKSTIIPTTTPVPGFKHPNPLRRSLNKASKGVWELQAGAGALSDLEYDQPNTRLTTQFQGGWFGALYPKRLWLNGNLSTDSENRVVPATRLQAKLFFANSRAWIRGSLRIQGASQYLHRFAHSYGVFAKLQFSLRSLMAKKTNWDLLTELRFSYRGLSRNTLAISDTSLQAALHRYIYRSYVQDHPFSLRPRWQFVWRGFYDLRTYLGQDLWLNSDFKSVDRSRAWLKLSGIIDPYQATTRVFWTYDTGYRLSYAPGDAHRSQAFWRNAFMLDLKASWRFTTKRRWELGASGTLFTQTNQPLSLRLLLKARVAFDRGNATIHRPIQHRRYPQELQVSDWSQESIVP